MTVSAFPEKVVSCLKAPGGSEDSRLERVDGGLRCVDSGEVYRDVDRVPSLFIDEDGTGVTGRVKDFYEENPFPNYEGLETFGDLVTKGNANARR